MAQRRTTRTDAWLIGAAVGFMAAGAIALIGVLVVGLTGGIPSATLTWVAMITPPIAFILMIVEFVRMVRERNRSHG